MPSAIATVRNALVGLFKSKGLEGPIPPWWPVNFWQMGLDRRLPYTGDLHANAAVEACVGAITQTVASLPLNHWRKTSKGGREEVLTSAASRVLRKPNQYQTQADFFLNLLRAELFTGNGYALALRNNRYEIAELHLLPPRGTSPNIAVDGSIWYNLGVQPLLPDIDTFVPARDILHIRLHTPRDPLRGETPISAASLAVSAGNSIQTAQAGFFTNMSRPSGVLESPNPHSPTELESLRLRWNELSTGMNAGNVLALAQGITWKPLTMSAVDAQLVETYKMTVADVARVYRVPLPIIGEMTGATYNNVESLIRFWLNNGLIFILNHLEQALDALFGLPVDEWTEFNTEGLLRSDFLARIEGLTKAVIGGVMSPNEARAMENLPAVEAGDEPRVQQQVVPLSAWDKAPAQPAPAPGAPPPSPNTPAKAPAESQDAQKAIDGTFMAMMLESARRASHAAC